MSGALPVSRRLTTPRVNTQVPRMVSTVCGPSARARRKKGFRPSSATTAMLVSDEYPPLSRMFTNHSISMTAPSSAESMKGTGTSVPFRTHCRTIERTNGTGGKKASVALKCSGPSTTMMAFAQSVITSEDTKPFASVQARLAISARKSVVKPISRGACRVIPRPPSP